MSFTLRVRSLGSLLSLPSTYDARSICTPLLQKLYCVRIKNINQDRLVLVMHEIATCPLRTMNSTVDCNVNLSMNNEVLC